MGNTVKSVLLKLCKGFLKKKRLSCFYFFVVRLDTNKSVVFESQSFYVTGLRSCGCLVVRSYELGSVSLFVQPSAYPSICSQHISLRIHSLVFLVVLYEVGEQYGLKATEPNFLGKCVFFLPRIGKMGPK